MLYASALISRSMAGIWVGSSTARMTVSKTADGGSSPSRPATFYANIINDFTIRSWWNSGRHTELRTQRLLASRFDSGGADHLSRRERSEASAQAGKFCSTDHNLGSRLEQRDRGLMPSSSGIFGALLAEQVDAARLKREAFGRAGSTPAERTTSCCGIEQRKARELYELKVVGSNPTLATAFL